jgi:hypothetical protein
MKKIKLLTLTASLLSVLMLTSCNAKTPIIDDGGDNTTEGDFEYEDPTTGIVPDDGSGDGDGAGDGDGDGPTDNFGDLDIEVIATVNANGTFVAEAEDCDTSGCTLQAGCGGFFETPSAPASASGGMCIACIAAPSILAFSFTLEDKCNVEFQTVSAKYEDSWNLDENVAYYVDRNKDESFTHTLTSGGFKEFGHTDTIQWYNWKTVSLGSLDLAKGTHTMYIKVNNAFPNTDCFNLVATNYGL